MSHWFVLVYGFLSHKLNFDGEGGFGGGVLGANFYSRLLDQALELGDWGEKGEGGRREGRDVNKEEE